jgi:integrase
MEAKNDQKNGFSKLLKQIERSNHNKKIKLRCRPTDKKGYTLYLDLWSNGRRQYEFLSLYLEGKTKSLQSDQDILRIGYGIRDQKEIELLEKRTGFELSEQKTKANFIDYFSALVQKKSHHNWNSCLKHLIDFAGRNITFSVVDRRFSENFKEYLLSKVDQNTAQSYFAKFKAALNIAVDKEIIKENPSRKVTIQKRETTREFLTYEEIKKAIAAPCADREVKNAFIFSCFTGLRISDVRELTFDRINEEHLEFRQQKTQGVERLKLHPKAISIIKAQRELRKNSENNKVFILPIDTSTINKYIRNWMKEAGIQKRITYHCSRHSFATLCLTFDVDIYTVSKLLGHRDLKTTEVYAKLVDRKKDEAIAKLPTFE